MKTIYKYPLETTHQQLIEMPIGAQIIAVQIQYGIPILWAIVDTDREKEERDIRIYGSGNPIPENHGFYRGTYQLHEGKLVFHVFEVI